MNKEMTTEWDVTLSKIDNLQTILWNVKHEILETLNVNIFEEVLTKEQLNLSKENIFNYFTDKFLHDYGEWDYSDIASDLIQEGNTWLVEYLKKWRYPSEQIIEIALKEFTWTTLSNHQNSISPTLI